MTTPSALPKVSHGASRRHRAFRITSIPTHINRDELSRCLEALPSSSLGTGDRGSNIHALTLVTEVREQVATVVFDAQPECLEDCTPGRVIEVRLQINDSAYHVTFDCDFFGLTPLYSSDKYVGVDIIAVTGLAGHPYGSWKVPNGYLMWLRDLLPKDLPPSRVYTYGYNSTVGKSLNNSSISDYAQQLLHAISYSRQLLGEKRPLIFIGHSLGGLVIKSALARAGQSRDESQQEILKSTVGIFLFGVPNGGLNHRNLLNLAHGQRNYRLISDLMEDSELLQLLNFTFDYLSSDILKNCRIVSFYETLDTPTVTEHESGLRRDGPPVRMVTRESATSASRNTHDHIPIDGNHSTIVKFTSSNDNGYQSFARELLTCYKNIPDAPPIEGHADIPENIKDDDGRTPLSHAAERGDVSTVRRILKRRGVDVNTMDNYGRTPLSYAIVYGHAAIPPLLQQKDINVEGALIWALDPIFGDHRVIRQLLARTDVDVNVRDENGNTALSLAVLSSQDPGAMVREFLKREDIDVNAKDDSGRTALSYAVVRGHAAVKPLLEHKDIDVHDALLWALDPIFGDHRVIRQLLARPDVDVNARDENGKTALSLAVLNSQDPGVVVREFLKREDIDVNAKDDSDHTALSYAVVRGHAAVQPLLEHKDIDVHGALFLAVDPIFGDHRIVGQLLDRKDVRQDIDARDENGKTAFTLAGQSYRDPDAMVREFLKRGISQ